MPVFFAQTLEDMPTLDDLRSRSGYDFMRDILEGRLSGPPMGETLGFTVVEIEEGRAVFEGTPTVRVTNPMRGVHGGWYGAILDSVMGCAVMTIVPKGRIYTTLEYKVNITRAIKLDQTVRAVSVVDHAGRSTAVARGELRGVEDNKRYATGSTTCMIMDAPVG
jgi:uncharacterized protein (TIGR00369 family)